jgi:tripartite-type tricarboxylate transporter receptor subunit TctC
MKKEEWTMNYIKIRFWKQFLCLLVIVAAVTVVAGHADAQPKYPARAIDLIVPMSPGGSTDLSARLIATYVNQKWKVPVNVINKSGGNCVPGSLEVFSSAPDGYTLLMDGSSSTYLMLASVKNLPFKLMDRTFTGSVIGTPHIIVVPASSSVKTLKDLEAEAKKDPDSFTWTSLGGVGGQDFLIREFLDTIGVDVRKTKPILAKGGAESIALTAGGHVKMGGSSVSSAIPAIQGGLIRPLAVTSKERSPDLPDVPTTAEVGYPAVDVVNWLGISGPAKLPANVIAAWDTAMQEMLKDPEVQKKMKNIGVRPFYLDANKTVDHVNNKVKVVTKLWKLN